jgi:hypothetical protein
MISTFTLITMVTLVTLATIIPLVATVTMDTLYGHPYILTDMVSPWLPKLQWLLYLP